MVREYNGCNRTFNARSRQMASGMPVNTVMACNEWGIMERREKERAETHLVSTGLECRLEAARQHAEKRKRHGRERGAGLTRGEWHDELCCPLQPSFQCQCEWQCLKTPIPLFLSLSSEFLGVPGATLVPPTTTRKQATTALALAPH